MEGEGKSQEESESVGQAFKADWTLDERRG